MAGKLWFLIGFIILFTGFLPLVPFIIVFFSMVALATVIPTVYSYRYYKSNIESGKQSETDYNFKGTANSKTVTVIVIAVSVVLTVACVIILFTGNVEFTLTDTALEIDATYYASEVISYDDIDAVEYRENADKGTRVMGFGTPRLLLGSFRNDELGAFTRFSYTKCDSDIIITVGDERIAVSCETEAQTLALYEAILEKLNK